MKVGNPLDKAVGGLSPTKGVGEGSGSASRTEGKSSAAASDSTTVKISSAASSLLSSSVSAANAEFDAGKVEKVKQAIDDGTYQVDHGAIADKLIANAQEVLSKKSR